MENEINEIIDKDQKSDIFDFDEYLKEIEEIDKTPNKTDELLKEAKKSLSQIKNEFSQKKLTRKKYTLKEKAAIIVLMENKISKHFIENEYGISRKTLREWKSKKDEILSEANKKKFPLKGGGRKPDIIEIEQEILFWINTCKRNGLSISCSKVIAYAIKLFWKDFKKTYNSYWCWIFRFLARNNLSIRKISYEGQKISENIENLTYKFLLDCIKKRKYAQINDDIECFINIDEVPSYLENPGKETIDINCNKKI